MVVSDYMANGIVVAVLVLLVVKVSSIVLDTLKLKRRFKDFPQNPSHPILGHLTEFPGPNQAGYDYQRETITKYPRLHVFWLGIFPIVYVTDPNLVKIILKTEPKAYFLYRFLYPWLGQGLLTSNGNRWNRSRRLLTPAFHFDILKSYLQLKNEACVHLLEKFEASSKSGKSLDLFECVSMYTLDVILQSTMSYETGCQKAGKKHPYIISVNRIMTGITSRVLKPWLHPDWLYFITPAGLSFYRNCRFVHKIADEIIKKRRKELESKVSGEENGNTATMRKRRDFLDTLITARDEAGNGLTDKEIRDEVDTFLFEGHDTTASAISWCLYSLAEHPDIQQRVQEEVDHVFEGRDNDALLWEDMNKLPYLTMALKEAMRLHSPVPSIMRESTRDINLDGHIVPKGSNVSISIYNIHHNPNVWEDSLKYDPERFSTKNSENRDPFAFVPFSAGPRNCIGQNFAMDEMKVALARILHRFEISLDPNHEVIKQEALVLKAETDIKMYVKPRLSSQSWN